jgi:hypothetical protein
VRHGIRVGLCQVAVVWLIALRETSVTTNVVDQNEQCKSDSSSSVEVTKQSIPLRNGKARPTVIKF